MKTSIPSWMRFPKSTRSLKVLPFLIKMKILLFWVQQVLGKVHLFAILLEQNSSSKELEVATTFLIHLKRIILQLGTQVNHAHLSLGLMETSLILLASWTQTVQSKKLSIAMQQPKSSKGAQN